MRGGLRSIASNLKQCFFDAIYPKHCLACDLEGSYWCLKCQTKDFKKWDNNLNLSGEKYFDEIVCLGDYEDKILGELIKTCKYRFVKELSKDLANLLAIELNKLTWPGLIVPVPLSARRQRWRGFNQSEEIALALCKQNNYTISYCLQRVLHKKAQAKLSEAKRILNMQDCFEVRGEVPAQIILLDDVVTTGSTVNECAKKLRQGGAKEIRVIALAKG